MTLFLGTLVLHDAVERIYLPGQYGEQVCGLFLIRGENISLLGEFDDEKDKINGLEQLPFEEMMGKQRELKEEAKRLQKARKQMEKDYGLMEFDLLPELDI
jgi:U6 snRNA-associated Sm-like protein LSm1